MTDQTAAIEVWARMLCAADVHVHGEDHPNWQHLVGETGSQIRDDYRKAAAWLLPKMTVDPDVRLARAERPRAELRAESKRRGKVKLEYAERIRQLENQLDEVRTQLGAEILRSGQAEAELRRMADETPPAETEAQPPHHRWYVETRDGVADEWVPGQRFTDRSEAAERYLTVSEHYPTWEDGSPVQRRFVRETTSYTVEDPGTEAVPAQPGKEA